MELIIKLNSGPPGVELIKKSLAMLIRYGSKEQNITKDDIINAQRMYVKIEKQQSNADAIAEEVQEKKSCEVCDD